MEYGLRGRPLYRKTRLTSGRLNPCFNGIWSARDCAYRLTIGMHSLNPCFNGIWSARSQEGSCKPLQLEDVLILVLMEYGLRGSNL